MTALAAVPQPSLGNVEAEMAVISAMLCEPRFVDTLADIVRAEDFSDQFLGYVFGTILSEHGQGRVCNPITLRPRLESEPAFKELGGMAWLARLTGTPAAQGTMVSGKACAQEVAENAKRRRLIEGLRETIAAAADLNHPVAELCEAADSAIADARREGEGHETSAAAALDALIEGFDSPVLGVTCGNIPSVDRLLGPMRRQQLIIGAGRPGMGKTALAVSYALGAAQQGYGVLFVSLEMSAPELIERMVGDLCLEHRIPYQAITGRTLTMDQKRDVCRLRSVVADLPLQIVDRGGLTFSQLRTLARRWDRRFAARGKRLDLIIVDYLQLLRPDTRMDAYARVSEASVLCKELAKNHECAVFALAQLSRAVEQRGDRRPQLSDLRDSGQIEQDADAILFLLREEYYLRQNEPTTEADRAEWERRLSVCQGRIEFICAKRRGGPTGSATGDFLYHYQAVRG